MAEVEEVGVGVRHCISYWDNGMHKETIERIEKLNRNAEALWFKRRTALFLEPVTESLLAAVVMLNGVLEFAVPMGYRRIYDNPDPLYWRIHHPKGWISSGKLKFIIDVKRQKELVIREAFLDRQQYIEFEVSRHFNPARDKRRKLAEWRQAQPKPIKPPNHLIEVFKLVKPVQVVDDYGRVGWHIPFWREEHPLANLIPNILE